MDFRILGPLEVERDGVPVEIGGGQLRALLALLLSHANKAVSTDRLVDELWGERPPAGAHKNVQVLVSRLRKALGEDRVETRANGYVLRVAEGELDVDRFHGDVEQGRRALAEGNPERARRLLGEALELWRDAPLADVADVAFVQNEIARLEELRLAATEDRIDADLALGSDRELVPELERLVGSHPFRERLLGQLMLALYRSGRQAAALDRYRDARRAFAEQLGIEPGSELRDLERAILNQDVAFAPPKELVHPTARVHGRRRVAFVAVPGLALAALALALGLTLTGSGQRTLSKLASNSIGVIDPKHNTIVAQIPLGSPPTKVVAGDGAVWAISNAGRVLWRIDTRARRLAGTIGLDGAASAIAVAPDAVWVLNGSSENPTPDTEVSRVNPRFGQVVSTVPTGGEYTDVTDGALVYGDGALWAVDAGSETQLPPFAFDLLRIDPLTRRVRRVRGSAGLDVAIGEGALWTIPGGVSRIDPRTLQVDASISVAPTGGPVPNGVTIGDGSVWTANAYPEFPCGGQSPCKSFVSKAGTVTRIDPRQGRVTTTITVGRDPVAIAFGMGAVWVANRSSDTLSRIDPASNRVVATIKLGSPPAAIAVGGDAVWVAVG